MRKLILGMSAVVLTAVSAPAMAQDDTMGLSVSGGASIVSDYRFRGVSLNNEEAAIQGWATVSHDSGFYVGFWGSSTTANQGTEIDAIAGYSAPLGPVTVDGGVTYYLYPGGTTAATDYFEPYLSVSGDVGPASLKVGVAWAPNGQNALGDDSVFYGYGDVSVGIPSTPLTAKAHIGYNKSDFYVGGISAVSNDDDYIDYSLGLEASWQALTFGVSYVNTDFDKRFGNKEAFGADGTVVFSVGASF